LKSIKPKVNVSIPHLKIADALVNNPFGQNLKSPGSLWFQAFLSTANFLAILVLSLSAFYLANLMACFIFSLRCFKSTKHRNTKYKTQFIVKSLQTILSLYENLLKILTTQDDMNLMERAWANFCRTLSLAQKNGSSFEAFFSVYKSSAAF